MALRLHANVVKGEIDNTAQGIVTGKVWLAGRDEPLLLELAGDCLRDLAGCRCVFVNQSQAEPCLHNDSIATLQAGEVGDITASRKVRIPGLPLDEWLKRKRLGLEAPEKMGNALYLEWYSDANGRVVVESADFQLQVSLPAWEMSEAQALRQQELNSEAMRRFLNRLQASLQPPTPAPKDVPGDDMDEHDWERFLRECDARTERFGEVLDKFSDGPDADALVAEHMGWSSEPEFIQPEEPEAWHDDLPGSDPLDDELDFSLPEPDPALEGIAWIRTEWGSVRHPLQHRCLEFAIQMHRDIRAEGLMDGSEDEPVDIEIADLIFHTQRIGVKLGGVLTTVAEGQHVPVGFVVATMKRALEFLHQALEDLEKVNAAGKLAGFTESWQTQLLRFRTEIIDEMNRFRRSGS